MGSMVAEDQKASSADECTPPRNEDVLGLKTTRKIVKPSYF